VLATIGRAFLELSKHKAQNRLPIFRPDNSLSRRLFRFSRYQEKAKQAHSQQFATHHIHLKKYPARTLLAIMPIPVN
jgi:hypothetical protein